GRKGQDGRRGQARRGAHREVAPPPRWFLHPLRRERRGDPPPGRRAARHPHLRPRGPRAARQEAHEDHLAGAGGALTMAQKSDPKKQKKNTVNIKKGDTVKVIAGQDKGAEGKVIAVLREEQRVIVEGVNRVKRHTKVVQSGGRAGTTGGIITTEAPIHVSNVMLVEGNGVTRPVLRRDEVEKRRPDGSTYVGTRSVRISRKTGKEI